MKLLEVENLSVNYGKTEAIRNISFSLEEGQTVSIIGSNGAGKSSLLKSISGLVDFQGSIRYNGQVLSRKANKIVAAGIIHVPEGRRIFSGFTVEDNMLAGAYLNKDHREVLRMMEEQFKLFPLLKERRKQYGATLSGGEQQMLAIARAMMSGPKLLLLDEPSLGLAPKIITTVFQIIEEIKSRGITVLLVEQNARKALAISDYAFVLENGKINSSGTGCDLLQDKSIAEAYLGTRKRDCTPVV